MDTEMNLRKDDQNKLLESDPSCPPGAGALLVAAEPHQLINTTQVCQEEEKKNGCS